MLGDALAVQTHPAMPLDFVASPLHTKMDDRRIPHPGQSAMHNQGLPQTVARKQRQTKESQSTHAFNYMHRAIHI